MSSDNPYEHDQPRPLIAMMRYALAVAEKSDDEVLELVAADLRDAAMSLLPAAEFLEELRPLPAQPVVLDDSIR